jgi:hypothetical protein
VGEGRLSGHFDGSDAKIWNRVSVPEQFTMFVNKVSAAFDPPLM